MDIQRFNSRIINSAKSCDGSRNEAKKCMLAASQSSSVFNAYSMEFPPLPSSNRELRQARHLGRKKDKIKGKYRRNTLCSILKTNVKNKSELP